MLFIAFPWQKLSNTRTAESGRPLAYPVKDLMVVRHRVLINPALLWLYSVPLCATQAVWSLQHSSQGYVRRAPCYRQSESSDSWEAPGVRHSECSRSLERSCCTKGKPEDSAPQGRHPGNVLLIILPKVVALLTLLPSLQAQQSRSPQSQRWITVRKKGERA